MKKMQKGFTLIELMVVIVIIGILSAIAIPRMTSMSAKAKVAEAPGVMASYERLQQAYIAENSATGTSDVIKFVSPVSKFFTYSESASSATTMSLTGTIIGVIGDCPASQAWKTTVVAAGTYSRDKPSNADCAQYTPNF